MTRSLRPRWLVILIGVILLGSTACQLVEKRTNQPVKKVLLVGDSVIWYAHPYIQKQFATWGAEVENIAVPGTGPLFTMDGEKVWARLLTDKLTTYDADIVIFQSCCHYPGGPQDSALYVNSDGVTVQPGTELMYTELAKANAELVQLTRDSGASPYWVKIPPGTAGSLFYSPTINIRIDRFNELVDGLDVPVLDWGAAVLAQPNVADLRHPDGIHYTPAGNTFLAKYTFNQTVTVAT